MAREIFTISEIEEIRKSTRERAKLLLQDLADHMPDLRRHPKYAELERILYYYAM